MSSSGVAATPPDAGAAPRAPVPFEGARAALAFFALALLATAPLAGLFETTETRYAEIAREMVASGDWLMPRLNGIAHLHKPPLTYWLTGASFAAFGPHDWAARLPVALASALTLAFAAIAARRRFAPLGVSPALTVWALGSTVAALALGRNVATDPFLAASVAAWWALAPSAWAAAALGFGFLAKGPVVLVPTVLAVLVASIGRDGREARRLLGPPRGWLVFAVVALTWYVVLIATVPGLLQYWLGDQVVGRYASTRHHRGGAPLYFVGVLVLGALPWTFALVRGLAATWRDRARLESRLLLAWLFVPVVFLSFSGSKLPAYLLPAFPAAALLVARGWPACGPLARGATAVLLAGLAAAGWIAGPHVFAEFVGLVRTASVPLPFAAHAGLFALGYAATWAWRARLAPAAALFSIGVLLLFVAVAPFEARLGSPRPLARVLAEHRAPQEPVVEYLHFAAGYPFYLREPVRLLEVPREREFDTARRLQRVTASRESLVAWTGGGRRVWMVGPEAPTSELATALGLDYHPIARAPGVTVGFVVR